MSDFGSFLGGFAQSFGQGLRQNQQQKQLAEQQKARDKLLKAQLDKLKLDEQAAAMRGEGLKTIMGGLQGTPAQTEQLPEGFIGPANQTPAQPGPSVTELLADPKMAAALLQAPDAARTLTSLAESQRKAQARAQFAAMMGGGGGGPGAISGGFGAPGAAQGPAGGVAGAIPGAGPGAGPGGAPGGAQAGGFGARPGGGFQTSFTMTDDGDIRVSLKPKGPASPAAKLEQDIADYTSMFGPNDPRTRALMSNRAGFQQPPDFSAVGTVRKEFAKVSEPNVVSMKGFRDLMAVSEDPTGAGDIAMIFSFMKLLDPGSRVTEGETGLASEVSGKASQLLNMYNRILKGERLTPRARADLRFQAANVARGVVSDQRAQHDRFTGIAQRGRVNPADVVFDYVGDTEGLLEGAPKPTNTLADSVRDAEQSLVAGAAVAGQRVQQVAGAAADIAGASMDDLGTMLDSARDPEQLRRLSEEVEARMRRLQGGADAN